MSEQTSRYEYVIWGTPPNQEDDTLLFAGYNGQPLTDKEEALRVKGILEQEHGCTKCRIQTIDMFRSAADVASDWRKVI